jgi:NAD(P)-dependent dehydrogenase (short-subunit alcohol dehydrogenase family)
MVNDTMKGKTCLITGGTSGIGKEIAIGLAKMNAKVVLVGRDECRCEETVREIMRNAAGISDTNNDLISYMLADLSSQASIRKLGEEFLATHGTLNVLVNNAGVFLPRRTTTVDGIEYTFAVNHLAPFLLTNLLLERIMSTTSSRIIITSSVAHKGAHIDFEDVQFERRRYNGLKAYAQSKLANILFTKELSRRSEGTGVTSNCFHPGGVRTKLVRTGPWYYRIIWTMIGAFLVTPQRGADTAVYLASSSEVKKISGKYFEKRKQASLSKAADDSEAAIRLWKLSEELTHIKTEQWNKKPGL